MAVFLGNERCSTDQLNAYFDRIQLPHEFRHGGRRKEQISALQAFHVMHMPWENLTLAFEELKSPNDTPLAREFTLDRLIDKLVHRRSRGGYCFEQNQLFQVVLRSLGYEVFCVLGRVVERPTSQPESRDSELSLKLPTHQIPMVRLEGRTYLVDVAFMADNPSQPLELEHMAATDTADSLLCGGRQHRLRKGVMLSSRDPDSSDNPAALGWYLQVDSRAHGWKDLYFFTETEFTANDFIPLNWYIVSNPHSPFNKEPHVGVLTREGRKTLVNRTFRVFSGKELLSERKLLDEEVKDVLTSEFGIVF